MRLNKMTTGLVALVLTLGLGGVASGQSVAYVDDDASLDGDGTAWNTAFKCLQDALAAATAGDEIHVAAGTYQPDQDEGGHVMLGEREATFQLVNGVAVRGGYRGCPDGDCGGDPDERDIVLYQTILSGDLNGDDGSGFANNQENSFHVVTGSGTDATAIVNGFTITAGNADGSDMDSVGAGMLITSGNPTVANCTFKRNSAGWAGGGMVNYLSSPMVADCTFLGNSAEWGGGGMFNYTFSSPTVADCTFSGNSAESGPAMAQAVWAAEDSSRHGFVREIGGLEAAVRVARAEARPGDVVLFSPGAPSFDAYANFAERGRQFTDAVNALALS